MIRHPIDYTYSGKVLGFTISVRGEVRVEYPNADIGVQVRADGIVTTEQKYQFAIGPDQLEEEQTKNFGPIPITVKLHAKPKDALLLIIVSNPTVGQLYTHPVSYRAHEGPHIITAYGLYAIFEELDGLADHTYIEAQDVHSGYKYIWPCGGAFEEGRQLISGEGNSNISDCLSQRKIDIKLAGGMARLRYLIDGVCHQGANRIMFPTGMIVDQACGWLLSHYIYGHYGVSAIDGRGRAAFIELLDQCYPEWADNGNATLNPSATFDEAYETEIFALRQHWRILTDGQLSSTQEDSLLEEREKIRTLRHEVAGEYGTGNVSGRDVANRLNTAVHTALDQALKVVKEDAYNSIFGMPPCFRMLLVDPEIAFSAFLPDSA